MKGEGTLGIVGVLDETSYFIFTFTERFVDRLSKFWSRTKRVQKREGETESLGRC